MNDRDPLDQLHTLADHAEEHASALPAERVRQLGDQRRHRRYGLSLAAALAVVAIGGGAVLSQTGTNQLQPAPVATPTAVVSAAPTPSTSPSPTDRSMTGRSLIIASDLVKPYGGTIQEWTENARSADRVSVCQQSLSVLGATSILSRNFAVNYPNARLADGPLANAPSLYTQALQFADAKAAEQALKTYQSWVANCRARIRQSSAYEVIGEDDKSTWITVTSNGKTIGRFTQVPLYRDKDETTENGYFETVGLTRVGDRLMVTVELQYSNEKHTSYQQGGDPETEIPEDLQFGLIRAAAKRLPG